MFNWYHTLNATERKTLHACFGGWAVDALDTQLFSFLIPTLIAAWSITNAQAGWLGTSALISSAVGGWVAGVLCDRIGRVKVMKLAIAWFFVFTILSGFSNSFEQLLLARTLSGIGFGGEWAAGAVLMGEIIRPQYRGKAVGSVQSAYALGYAFAAILSSILFGTMAATDAWRWMFWIGALPAILVLLSLRNVKEPEIFLEAKSRRARQGKKNVNPLMIFHPRYLRTTILCSMLALGIQAGGFSIVIWLPTFLKTQFQLTSVEVGYHVLMLTFGSFVGYISAAYLCDAIGRRRNFFLFTILNWLFIPLSLYAPDLPVLSFALNFVLGFSLLGIYSALGPYFTELFPSVIRGNGQGFSYNFGRAAGSFCPALVGVLSSGDILPLRDSMAIMAMSSYLFVLIAVSLLPETNGRDLADELDAGNPNTEAGNGYLSPTQAR